MDDPWHWSVERVLQELCTPGQPWQLRDSPIQMRSQLPKDFTEQCIDGSTLLRRINDQFLKEDLGWTAIGWRTYIDDAIQELRKLSDRYQQWFRENLARPEMPKAVQRYFASLPEPPASANFQGKRAASSQDDEASVGEPSNKRPKLDARAESPSFLASIPAQIGSQGTDLTLPAEQAEPALFASLEPSVVTKDRKRLPLSLLTPTQHPLMTDKGLKPILDVSESSKRTGFTVDEINKVIDASFAEMAKEWHITEKETSKTKSQDFKLWEESLQFHNQDTHIGQFQEDIEYFEKRLLEHRNAIHRSTWKSELAIRRQCKISELTIYARENCRHRISVLNGDCPEEAVTEEPIRPTRPKAQRTKTDVRKVRGSLGDNQSDSDFIVSDEEGEVQSEAQPEAQPKRKLRIKFIIGNNSEASMTQKDSDNESSIAQKDWNTQPPITQKDLNNQTPIAQKASSNETSIAQKYLNNHKNSIKQTKKPKQAPVFQKESSNQIDSDTDEEPPRSSSRRLTKNAEDMQKHDRERLEAQAARRQLLRAKLYSDAADEGVESDRGVIINESKLEHQGLVFINKYASLHIKRHQVGGIRFMWNQLITGAEASHGCLLAHTMGLGKTMQSITLLIAIAEAASSPDESVSSQIPPSLRVSKTLILCPAGLVDNWEDELLHWDQHQILGGVWKIFSKEKLSMRLSMISEWSNKGGVLIISYDMFRLLVLNRSDAESTSNTKIESQNALSAVDHSRVKEELLLSPSLVIADEAHTLKNAGAQITRAASGFKTTSRIALTASPLNNNLLEYHSMIDWIAPNYLGRIDNFQNRYMRPIEAGLFTDSTDEEISHSNMMLTVLQEDLSPKIHRADGSILQEHLEPKTEFEITLPLTDLQTKAYTIYVRSMLSAPVQTSENGDVSQSTVLSWHAQLRLICNHPACFLKKTEDQSKTQTVSNNKSTRTSSTRTSRSVSTANTGYAPVNLSEDVVSKELALFNTISDVESAEHSTKVKLLLQILDASKQVGDKVLVFSKSLPTLNYLEDVCKKQERKYLRLDGSTKMHTRQDLCKEFNTAGAELCLISTEAGGLGLNLYGANRIVIMDCGYNPEKEKQAIGRGYRIGQKKPVYVYKFIAGGTFEENIDNIRQFKDQLFSTVVDKKISDANPYKKLERTLFEPTTLEQEDLSSVKGMDPQVLDLILQEKDVGIRKIKPTDSFRKDKQVHLTAEQEKMRTEISRLENLRRSDPKAYALEEKLKAEEARKIEMPKHSKPGQIFKTPTVNVPLGLGNSAASSSQIAPNVSIEVGNSQPPSKPSTNLRKIVEALTKAQLPEVTGIKARDVAVKLAIAIQKALLDNMGPGNIGLLIQKRIASCLTGDQEMCRVLLGGTVSPEDFAAEVLRSLARPCCPGHIFELSHSLRRFEGLKAHVLADIRGLPASSADEDGEEEL